MELSINNTLFSPEFPNLYAFVAFIFVLAIISVSKKFIYYIYNNIDKVKIVWYNNGEKTILESDFCGY